YFMKLWNARNTGEVVLGFRTRREDGWSRLLISRILSLVVLFTTGVWVRDSNVPYRLINRSLLERVLGGVPSDARFPNVLLSIEFTRWSHPVWVPIRFRKRSAGTSTVNLTKMFHFAGVVSGEVRGLNQPRGERVVA